MAEKKDKPLTIRERRFIQGLSNGLSVAEAGRQAGYRGGSISCYIYKKIGKDRIRMFIVDFMKQKGLSDDRLIEKLSEGLEATRVVFVNEKKIEVPDYATRHRYLELALKLKGHLRDKVDINLSTETFEQRILRLRKED